MAIIDIATTLVVAPNAFRPAVTSVGLAADGRDQPGENKLFDTRVEIDGVR
jgi:hypothetical protein